MRKRGADKDRCGRRLQAEEKRKEKETLKALAQQERQTLRHRSRGDATQPKDDLDLELEGLAAQMQIDGYVEFDLICGQSTFY